MSRLQENIEKLKAQGSEDDSEEKVKICVVTLTFFFFSYASHMLVSFAAVFWNVMQRSPFGGRGGALPDWL